MRVIRNAQRWHLHLGRREHRLLLEVLRLYPCLPPAHQRLSKAANLPDREANQKLLDEALAEQRSENKRQLQLLLTEPQRFKPTDQGVRLSLSQGEVEWLLQVLNDIRVGSWVRLGAPEPKLDLSALNPTTAPHFWAMEMAGHFQMGLLHALEGP